MLDILSWNVAGWHRCLADSTDIPFLRRKFDIIALQETWTDDPLWLGGFHAFKVEARPGKGPGRLKGGLGILVSTALKVTCLELPPP